MSIRINVQLAPALRIVNTATKVTVSQLLTGMQGATGPRGYAGPVGPQGPAGLAANVPQDLIDAPDMVLLFDNALI